MKNINITRRKNHLCIELDKESFHPNLKSNIKNLTMVKIINKIAISNKIRLSIHPFKQTDLDYLIVEVEKKILKFEIDN